MSAEIDFPTRRARPHVEPRGGAGALGHDSAVGSRFPLQHTTVTEKAYGERHRLRVLTSPSESCSVSAWATLSVSASRYCASTAGATTSADLCAAGPSL